MNKIFPPFFIFTIALMLSSCSNEPSPDEIKYIEKIKKIRMEKDEFMQNDPSSPFNIDTTAHFRELNYYDVNPDFVFKSKLYEYENKDTVIILGTKGEKRIAVRYGYLKFRYDDKEYKVNVYSGTTNTGEEYFSIWFTDKTTGSETYGVGRYIDFEKNPDKEFIYTLDFNLAYNPYCAYTPVYSCAIPTKEDYIDLAIEAGEKNFH
ncbi:MAG: DUF1684 domain-containing protein [Ignavibacteriaceae bacterium]